ncbi:hypothetical protein PVAND_004799 [Polypedilum vanderplanki]|uniref:Protein-lysine N-methyltransferase SMYD4 n=1 Tax=Polypedilum vanderplanki TaxID=319348 RepID=A0A9J6C061_POLVA|nr:hypothetical protein PVAND_004799 [Polypedilum vanderplanki]
MSLPEQQKEGSKWDSLIRKLKENHRKLLNKSCCNEIQVQSSQHKSKEIKREILNYLNELEPVLKKSSQLSEEIRSEGNKIYKRTDPNVNLMDSIFLYTLSMKCSESNSDLAFAHGNRAAALMRLGFNKVARNDCEEAIRLEHPDPFKIYERMCSLSNGCIRDMRKNVAELEKFCKKGSKQSKEILFKYKTRLKAMEKETYVDEEEISKLTISESKEEEMKIKQMFSDENGRYVIAHKPIGKNEIIYKEIPYAFIPVHNYGMKRYFNTDCENCALVNIWPFMCLGCRHSVYCSSACRKEHEQIHKYECEGYKKTLFLEIGIAHLSLRVLIVGFKALCSKLEALDRKIFKNSPEKIFEKILELAKNECQDYFDISKATDEEFRDYARILCLQPNIFRNNSYPPRNLPYAYTAQMLTIYLREYTTFFQDYITNKIKDLLDNSGWDVFISALILRHIGQLISNGHAIIDFRQNIFTTEALKLMLLKNEPNGGGLHMLLKSQRVFTGIFPRISMLNHSCEPNIRNAFDGKQLTIFAARDISNGDEIFNCYGPHWKLMSYQERQDTLRIQYNFVCKCTKCAQNNDEYRFNNSVQCRLCGKRLFYPDKIISEDDDDDKDDDNDANFRLKCDDCKKVHENTSVKKFFSLLAQQSDNSSPITMNQLYTTYLSAVSGMGSLDEIRFHMTEMMLHTLITNRDAINLQNANIPLTLCIELLSVKEDIYGQFSIEFVEAGFFFLDVVSILIDKGIITEQNTNQLVGELMKKFVEASEICSTNIKAIIRNYISRFCYTYSD